MIRKWFFALTIMLSLVFAMPVSAAYFDAGDDVLTDKYENIPDDYYAAGGSVVVSKDVQGDLVAAGGSLIVSGSVFQDVLIAGGNLTLLGDIGDDLRAAGGTILLGKNIGDDAFIAGGTVHILPDAVIEGDLHVGGGNILIEGTVKGSMFIGGGNVTLSGKVFGDVQLEAAEALKISNDASVGGNLFYRATQEIGYLSEVVKGNVTYEFNTHAKEFGKKFHDIEGAFNNIQEGKTAQAVPHLLRVFAKMFTFMFFFGLVLMLLTTLLVVWLFHNSSTTIAEETLDNFGQGTLIGLATVILLPTVAMLLFISGIGSFVGLLVFSFFGFITMLAKLFTPIVFGAWMWKVFNKNKSLELSWKSTVLGVLLASLIGLIPVIGWLFMSVFFLGVLGSLMLMAYENYWEK